MVGEVNKLIFNTLTTKQAINLPGVGTLFVARTSAKIEAKNRVQPPLYTIEFSSHKAADSLVDEIAAVANIDTKSAQDIYDRWLDKVKEGSVITIEGVGELRSKSFVCNNDLLQTLNVLPSVTIRKRSNKTTIVWYIMALMMAGVCAGAAYYVLTLKDTEVITDNQPNKIVEQMVESPVNETVAVLPTEDATPEPIIEQEVEEPQVSEPYDWREDAGVIHRVVVGSYSTEENARRAMADIEMRLPELRCSVFTLGTMYAVAAFGSNDKAECEEFKRAYTKEFKQAWVHTPRRYRE
jgi:nucleoid DNA-binding protein